MQLHQLLFSPWSSVCPLSLLQSSSSSFLWLSCHPSSPCHSAWRLFLPVSLLESRDSFRILHLTPASFFLYLIVEIFAFLELPKGYTSSEFFLFSSLAFSSPWFSLSLSLAAKCYCKEENKCSICGNESIFNITFN